MIALLMLTPHSAVSGPACYTQIDCDCAFESGKLSDGQWQAKSKPGIVVSSMGMVFPMKMDQAVVETVSQCDGQLFLSYFDKGFGKKIAWPLQRVSNNESMLDASPSILNAVDPGQLADFTKVSPELADLDITETLYVGSIEVQMPQTAPATMFLGIAEIPGTQGERFNVSMTIRIGPTFVNGAGMQSIWMRSGPTDFDWIGSTQTRREHVYEVCRCEEVDTQIKSAKLLKNIYRRMGNQVRAHNKHRVGYGTHWGDAMQSGVKPSDILPMYDPAFQNGEPLVSPEMAADGKGARNWPCVPQAEQVTEGATGQDMVFTEFQKRWRNKNKLENAAAEVADGDMLENEFVTPKSDSAGKVAGNTNSVNCSYTIDVNRDVCKIPEVVAESMDAHERVHSNSCRKANEAAAVFRDSLNNLKESGSVSERALAARALSADAPECVAYQAQSKNAWSAAQDELKAYQAGLDVLERHFNKYCQ